MQTPLKIYLHTIQHIQYFRCQVFIRKPYRVIFFRGITHIIDAAIPNLFFINHYQLKRQMFGYMNRQTLPLQPLYFFSLVFHEHNHLHSPLHGFLQGDS